MTAPDSEPITISKSTNTPPNEPISDASPPVSPVTLSPADDAAAVALFIRWCAYRKYDTPTTTPASANRPTTPPTLAGVSLVLAPARIAEHAAIAPKIVFQLPALTGLRARVTPIARTAAPSANSHAIDLVSGGLSGVVMVVVPFVVRAGGFSAPSASGRDTGCCPRSTPRHRRT